MNWSVVKVDCAAYRAGGRLVGGWDGCFEDEHVWLGAPVNQMSFALAISAAGSKHPVLSFKVPLLFFVDDGDTSTPQPGVPPPFHPVPTAAHLLIGLDVTACYFVGRCQREVDHDARAILATWSNHMRKDLSFDVNGFLTNVSTSESLTLCALSDGHAHSQALVNPLHIGTPHGTRAPVGLYRCSSSCRLLHVDRHPLPAPPCHVLKPKLERNVLQLHGADWPPNCVQLQETAAVLENVLVSQGDAVWSISSTFWFLSFCPVRCEAFWDDQHRKHQETYIEERFRTCRASPHYTVGSVPCLPLVVGAAWMLNLPRLVQPFLPTTIHAAMSARITALVSTYLAAGMTAAYPLDGLSTLNDGWYAATHYGLFKIGCFDNPSVCESLEELTQEDDRVPYFVGNRPPVLVKLQFSAAGGCATLAGCHPVTQPEPRRFSCLNAVSSRPEPPTVQLFDDEWSLPCSGQVSAPPSACGSADVDGYAHYACASAISTSSSDSPRSDGQPHHCLDGSPSAFSHGLRPFSTRSNMFGTEANVAYHSPSYHTRGSSTFFDGEALDVEHTISADRSMLGIKRRLRRPHM